MEITYLHVGISYEAMFKLELEAFERSEPHLQ